MGLKDIKGFWNDIIWSNFKQIQKENAFLLFFLGLVCGGGAGVFGWGLIEWYETGLANLDLCMGISMIIISLISFSKIMSECRDYYE